MTRIRPNTLRIIDTHSLSKQYIERRASENSNKDNTHGSSVRCCAETQLFVETGRDRQQTIRWRKHNIRPHLTPSDLRPAQSPTLTQHRSHRYTVSAQSSKNLRESPRHLLKSSSREQDNQSPAHEILALPPHTCAVRFGRPSSCGSVSDSIIEPSFDVRSVRALQRERERYIRRRVCICICMYMYVYIQMYICIYIYIYICMCVCMCIHIYIYIYVYTHNILPLRSASSTRMHLRLDALIAEALLAKPLHMNTSRFVRVILSRGHANLLCIVPILTDDPRRES